MRPWNSRCTGALPARSAVSSARAGRSFPKALRDADSRFEPWWHKTRKNATTNNRFPSNGSCPRFMLNWMRCCSGSASRPRTAVRLMRSNEGSSRSCWHWARRLFQAFLKLVGPGDFGESVTLDDGRLVHRSAEQHQRRLLTVFGEFIVSRWVYAQRAEGEVRVHADRSAFATACQRGVVSAAGMGSVAGRRASLWAGA